MKRSQLGKITFKIPINNFYDKSLSIKAATLDEEPVLCTQNRTFTMRKQKYSDSLFLLAPSPIATVNDNESNQDHMDIESDNNNKHDKMSRNFELIDTLNHVCELTPSAPKIEQLDNLLNKTSYKGRDEEINYLKVC